MRDMERQENGATAFRLPASLRISVCFPREHIRLQPDDHKMASIVTVNVGIIDLHLKLLFDMFHDSR